ncbi:cytochrome c oxidase assembly factor 6 homolog isoform 1-T1 [Trichechus inunguis]
MAVGLVFWFGTFSQIPSSLLMSNVLLANSLIPLGMAAPSMKERQACWEARDEYWKCLDERTEDASQCKKLRSSFESSCPQQWIKYFDKRRDYLKFKEKFEAGQFQPSKTTVNS